MSDSKDFFGQDLAIGDYVIAGLGCNGEPPVDLYIIEDIVTSSAGLIYAHLQRQGTQRKVRSVRRTNNCVKISPSLITFKKLNQQ